MTYEVLPAYNIVRDEKDDLATDCHSILARWRNHFSQLFNVHGVNDFGHIEIHTAEPLVPEPRTVEFEMAIEKLKRHKSPGTDQIPAELITAGGRTIRYEIHKFINSIWNKELPGGCESIILPIYKKGAKTGYSERHITFVHYLQNLIQHRAVKLNSTCRGNNWRSSVWISTQQVRY